jgi:hypothetical protein
MEARMKLVELEPITTVETEPEHADLESNLDPVPCPLSIKRHSHNEDFSSEIGAFLEMHRSSLGDATQVERPVKILSYMGSLPDKVGNDGDFYVDEMTNMLYGPKANGIWPEDGVIAAGLCKRTWIAITRSRAAAAPAESGLMRYLKSYWRFLSSIRLVKGMLSFGSESRI